MKRLQRITMAALLAIPLAAVAAPVVDLDETDALARLRVERPQHFDTVVRILDDARRLPENEVIGWLRTHHQIDDPAFGPTLLVSYPPRRRLSFALDAVQYRATVVVRLPDARAVPARSVQTAASDD
jgi:hypothetical protein